MKLPQLSLRELFLLVVIAAMGCGWWLDRRGLVREKQAATENVKWPQTYLQEQNFELNVNNDGTMSIGTIARTNTH
jgi:hypothetical protein